MLKFSLSVLSRDVSVNCVTCFSVFCGPVPFPNNSNKGKIVSIAKCVAISLIVAAALSVCMYYGTIALTNILKMNPTEIWKARMTTMLPCSCIFGASVFFVTFLCLELAKRKMRHIYD